MDKFVVRKRRRVEETEHSKGTIHANEEAVDENEDQVRPSSPEDETASTVALSSEDEACSSNSTYKASETVKTSKRSRSFLYSWIKRWEWIKYVREKDSVVCKICTKAMEDNLLLGFERFAKDSPFIYGGFTNWKKAVEKFSKHETSSLHSASIRGLTSVANHPVQ